jgi:transcriptional regulator with XRE-family HTH domain
MSMTMTRVGKYVAHVRKLRGYTQLNLAKRVGLSRTSIANLEGGHQETPITTLERVADILGVSLVDMIAGELPECKHIWETVCRACGDVQQ